MINENFLIGIYQIIASLLIGIVAMYISYSLLYRFIFKKHNIKIDNIAYGILCSSILFSVAFLISGTTQSIITTMKILRSNGEVGLTLWKDILSYSAFFMFIGLVTSLLVNLISVFIFTRLTKSVDEMEEIKRNNLAIALVTGTIIIGLTLVVKDSMVYLVESLIPYPKIPNLY
jgi:uncharacterized membrane protein YjfL (UPF0719 family)